MVRLRTRWRLFRRRVDSNPTSRLIYRVAVAVLGSLIVLVGAIAIPYPGPGWALVFGGLAVLASEFAWAKRLLDYARARYDSLMAWQRRQPWPVRALLIGLTIVVVIATLWALGVWDLMIRVFN